MRDPCTATPCARMRGQAARCPAHRSSPEPPLPLPLGGVGKPGVAPEVAAIELEGFGDLLDGVARRRGGFV
uniref:Uncharacterized protein n=1 Tax=Setaria viridis TaxID=4556 RepID=A0A4U6T6A3_SETVI|nr:hypothetical protein SEVIR_9G484433v2 [Setaria viridis]